MLTRADVTGERGDLMDVVRSPDEVAVTRVRDSVADTIAAVRERGDAAVGDLTARFDGWHGNRWETPAGERAAALADLDPQLREALERAADRVRWFHERALPADWYADHDGARLGVVFRPLHRVGVYVPGGLGAYPSTVLMTVVPARVAGVDEVVVCTPPGPDGTVNPTILAAAELTGADRVLRIGGAQAIAAMAYGTETVPRCDKVVGPGNAYVAEAKMQVSAAGACGIDSQAGTTEVAIIADDTADPRLLACDLVAQAEHDPRAVCLLITPDPDLIDRTERALEVEVSRTRHADRVRAALRDGGVALLVRDLDQAVAAADAFAAEHLEVQTADAPAVAARVRAAGAIFVGRDTPVALGDYCAGPNHTLPTGGTARFSGGLSTGDFVVPVNWVEYGRDALADLLPVIDALAAAEDLPAHAAAVRARLTDGADPTAERVTAAGGGADDG
ncbi:MAG TPA: histidinol dehydrogenase [Euzebyales bacterium]|nr:histidinol dehydrogenase [Euzebyales bacterium]